MSRNASFACLSIVLAVLISCITHPDARSQSAVGSRGGGAGGNPKSFMLMQRGMQMHAAGDVAGAVQVYRAALSFDPKCSQCHMLLGVALSQTGDNIKAIQELKTAININANFLEARNNLGMIYQKTGEREEAAKQFMQCIQINPKYPFAYYHIGEILQQKGDLDHAIAAYETCTRLKPDYMEAQRDLGLAIFERAQQGDVTAALDKLLIAVKLVPNNPMLHYYLGTIYCADGKLDEAEAEFRRTTMIDSQHAAAHWELARVRYYRGDLDRCITEVAQAERINPVYSDSHKYPKVDPLQMKATVAMCKEFKGDRIAAVDVWHDVLAMQAFNPQATKHVEELEAGLRKEARSSGKKKKQTITYDPEEIQALVTKGIGQYDDGDLEGAKASFARALELNPASFEAKQNLGFCQEAEGDLNGAIARYREALPLADPQFDGPLYNMGYILEKMNLPTDAGLMYQRFHEIAGKYPYDPKHIVALQQEEARQRAKEEAIRRRGY